MLASAGAVGGGVVFLADAEEWHLMSSCLEDADFLDLENMADEADLDLDTSTLRSVSALLPGDCS